ncbi:Atu4866 domain-containing protein [Mucilaginibacter sp. FT3.2]|uniref:Atu4866 domain-containing protein n=1 Tax=Mucilaginibacter sp. FT3.2 TaxID=2723090 RepID=UPI00161EC14D|nr:Atu4866 domain-containing protein [Mucilaginibacter sp. FT3.2]MBB6230563.1 hypothetical protein [Mucilaginibacter sp. FT3.2]
MERTNNLNWFLTIKNNEHIGVWETKDGYIRHEFLPNGRYNEARGDIKSAFTGYYNKLGNHVEFLDDSGFTTGGDFKDGVFYHAGTVLYRAS